MNLGTAVARASLGPALILQWEQPRQVPNTVMVAVWLIAVAAILAVGVAAAIRWPTAAASRHSELGTPLAWRGPGSAALARGC